MNYIGKRVKTVFGKGTVLRKENELNRTIRYVVKLDEPERWILGENPCFFVRDLESLD